MSALVLWLVLTLLTAQHNETNPTGNQYKVEFQIVNAGILVTGTIDEVSAEIHFDEAKLDKCSVIAKANPKAIRSGIVIRDKHLQRKDYFHSDQFPEIKLVSTSFKKTGRNKFIGQFKLTIKEITRQVIIPISISQDGKSQLYTGRFTFNRLVFGLGEESSILNNEVTVLLTAHTKSQ